MTASTRGAIIRTAVTVAKLSKGMRFAFTALKFIAIYIVLFSVAQYISFLVTGVEQTQLIDSTYTVIACELGGLLAKRILEKLFGKNTNTDTEE